MHVSVVTIIKKRDRSASFGLGVALAYRRAGNYNRIVFKTLCILKNLPAQLQDERLLLGGYRFGGPQVGTPITHSNKYRPADDIAKGNRQKILP